MRIKIFAPVSYLLLLSAGLFLFYACTKDGMNAGDAATGKGGSLARFTIAGQYLYVVDNHYLYAYSLANPKQPTKVSESQINFDIETIYPYKDNLFIGTRTGMYIYSLQKPGTPTLVGEARHARSCDPVVANDSVAFVTLKSGTNCGPATSGLYVHDIKDLSKPVLKKMIELPEPVGLGLQDSVLYISCGNQGLKVFNVNKPYEPQLLETIKDADYIDVIPYNGTLICYVSDGIVLYDISKPDAPAMVKKISN